MNTRANLLLAIITLLVILALAVNYSQLRARYNWLFQWYDGFLLQAPKTAVNIGPMRAVVAYERPWLSNLIYSRPVTQSAAEFLLRLVQIQVSAQFILTPPFVTSTADPAAGIKILNALVASPDAWAVGSNALFVNGHIPYDSALVQGYAMQTGVKGTSASAGDLSLQVLWLHGYEEYIRERFTWAATSVLAEWNFMFADSIPIPPAPSPAAGCDTSAVAGGFINGGMAGAGVGAMLGAPEGGIGAIPGAFIGFIVGGVGSLVTKTQCL